MEFRRLSDHSLLLLLRLGIVTGLVCFLAHKLEWSAVVTPLFSADWKILLLATIMFQVTALPMAYRWRELLVSRKQSTPLGVLLKYCYIGCFFNFFMPTAVGGDVARGYCLCKRGVSTKVVFGSILVDRGLGICALAAVACAAVGLSIVYQMHTGVEFVVLALSFCLLAGVILLYHGPPGRVQAILPAWVARRLQVVVDFVAHLRQYRSAPLILAACFGVSVLIHLLAIVSTYLLGVSLGSSVAVGYYMLLLPVVWLVAMIPVSINGLGLRESAFVVLFMRVGMSKETAVAVSILFLLQAVLRGLVGALLFLADRRVVSMPSEELAPQSQ